MKHVSRIILSIGLLAALLAAISSYRVTTAGPALPLTVTVDRLNVRHGPGTGYAIIGVLQAGDQVTALGRNVGTTWYQVQLTNGQAGWISATYVQAAGDAGVLPEVAAPALSAVAARSGIGGPGHIVFQTSSGGAIYVVNPDGSGLRQLTTGIDPVLSPNGQMVAFTRWDLGGADGALGSVWVINIDGTNEHKILADVHQPKSPTWSPNGEQIAISMQQGGTIADTWTCIINGQPKTNLPNPIDGAPCRKDPANPWWGLRMINLADGTFQDLPRAAHSFTPTWNPTDRNLIVFHGDKGLMTVNLLLQTTHPLSTNVDQRSPVFSPDGTRLALSYRQDNHWEVHVLNADGSGDVRLTQTSLTDLADQIVQGLQPVQWNNAAPAWSPDGSRIAFLSDRRGKWEIWVMNPDGSNQHPLVASGDLNTLDIQYNGVDERVISWR